MAAKDIDIPTIISSTRKKHVREMMVSRYERRRNRKKKTDNYLLGRSFEGLSDDILAAPDQADKTPSPTGPFIPEEEGGCDICERNTNPRCRFCS